MGNSGNGYTESVPSSHSWARLMKHRDLGSLSLVQAKGVLSSESVLPTFLAVLPSVALHGCGAGLGYSLQRGMDLAPHPTLPNYLPALLLWLV